MGKKVKLGLLFIGLLGLVGLLSACTSGDRIQDDLYISNLYANGNIAIGQLGDTYTLTLNGVPVGGGSGMIPLTSAHLYVGDVSNTAVDVAATGDLTVDNTGLFTVTGLNGVALPAFATGYLYYDLGTSLWSFGAGGGVGDMTKATYDPANISEQLVGLTAAQALTNKQITMNNNEPIYWNTFAGVPQSTINLLASDILQITNPSGAIQILGGDINLNYNIDNDIYLWGGTKGEGRELVLYSGYATGASTLRDSPILNMAASYWDGGAAVGWSYNIINDMVTAGATPKSQVIHSINSVPILTLINDNGTASLNAAGNLSITGASNELRFYEGVNYVGFEAPALAGDQIWVLPDADGSPNDVLTTDGSGNLSWAAVGGGTVTSVTATSPLASSAGTTPDISLNYDSSTLEVTIGGNLNVKSGVWLPIAGNAASATYASNVTITNDATNATMYPVWVTANTGNIPLYVTSGDLTYNPSTGNLTATTFTGALSGNASTATTAGSATNATNTANIAITDDTTTNATMYPVWVTTTTGNLPSYVSSTKLSFNPSSSTLTASIFVGDLTGNADTVTGLSVTAGKTLTVTGDATISGTPLVSPMTTLGDIIYEDATPAAARLAGDTSNTNKFLRSLSIAGVAQAPSWQSVTKTDVGLSAVENTALSTWAGSANITTVGTIASGTWNGTDIAVADGGTGLGTIADGSILATNTANVLTEITWHAAGTKVLTNTSGTISWETAAASGATTALDNLASVAINTSLVSDTDITDDLGTGDIRWRDIYSATLNSGLTAGDTLKLRGYDVNGATYVDILTITSNNTVTADLDTSVTLGGQYIYRAGGTDVPVTDGGTGLSAVADGSILAANAADTLSAITWHAAGTKVLTNTSGTISWEANPALVNPMTTLGDIIYEDVTPAPARLAGDTSDTKKFLTTLSIAGVAQAPSWGTIAIGDLPTITPAKGGTGVANGTNNTITFTGNYTLGLTLSNNTSVTLPTSGTLSTLAGAETITGKVSYNGLVVTANTGAITTGAWNATVITGQYGGTGVANTGKTITLGGNLTTSGAYACTLTLTNTTSVTMPTTGTLATLAGTETFTNKTLTQPIIQISLTAGENIAQYDACYVKSDGKVYKAKADSSATMPALLIAQAAVNINVAGNFMGYGYITNAGWAFTPGQSLFVSQTTGGLVTNTAPSSSGNQIQVVGIAVTATQMAWNPSPIVLELQ